MFLKWTNFNKHIQLCPNLLETPRHARLIYNDFDSDTNKLVQAALLRGPFIYCHLAQRHKFVLLFVYQGSFHNYVDKIVTNVDSPNPSEWTIVAILHTTWPNMDFLMTPASSCPSSCWSLIYFCSLHSECQNHEDDCAHFCGLLRKAELYIGEARISMILIQLFLQYTRKSIFIHIPMNIEMLATW